MSSTQGSSPINIEANDINDDGLIVGTCRYNAYDYVPCTWNQSNLMGGDPFGYSLGFIDGYTNGNTVSVNNFGKMVGFLRDTYSQPRLNKPTRAFIWDIFFGMRFIGTLNGVSSAANCINNNDQVVGASGGVAFIWNEQNGIRPLSTVINSNEWTFSYPQKINDANQILGRGIHQGTEKTFFWDGNQIYIIGNFPEVEAFGLNDAGQVVGQLSDANGSYQAFIWDKINGLQNLNSIVSINGWTLTKAVDINNRGTIIANGQNSEGVLRRVWKLTRVNPKPLIFIPGVAGSILKDQATPNDDILWIDPTGLINPFNSIDLEKLSLHPNRPNPVNIVAPDILRYKQHPVHGRTYETYGRIIDFLKSQGYSEDPRTQPDAPPNLFVFPYDWRRSNAENAVVLKAKIQQIKALYPPDTKVDIVAHSMGGLLARRYILDNNNAHSVDKMITIGSPWLGAPKALYSQETGRFFFNYLLYEEERININTITYFLDLQYSTQLKRLLEDFKGPQELIPSSSYYLLGGRPFEDINNYGSLVAYLNNRYFRTTPGTTNESFHTIAQDDWRQDNTGVKYYHIYGLQNRNVTPGKVVKVLNTKCLPYSGGVNCSIFSDYSIKATVGDGTVPIISARRKNESIDLNYTQNQTGDYRFFIVKPSSANDDEHAEHNGLQKNPAVQKLVADLLFYPSYGLNYTGDSRAGTAGVSADTFGNFLLNTEIHASSLYITLSGINVSTLERNLPSIPEITQTAEPFFQANLLGEKSAQVIVDPGESSIINFKTTDEPLRLEILGGTTNTDPNQAIRYLDVNLPVEVNCSLGIIPNNVENLRCDTDADGEFETEVTPTVSVNGANAKDLTAPEIAFSYNPLTQLATINATDNLSGVRRIYYSLNGTNFQIYTQPVSVNVLQTPRIYAFAEDNVFNRSQILNQYLLAPTASTAFIRGKILNYASSRQTTVMLIKSSGETIVTRTNPFGYYQFNNLPVGENYIVTPSAKGRLFDPSSQVINLLEDTDNVDFTMSLN